MERRGYNLRALANNKNPIIMRQFNYTLKSVLMAICLFTLAACTFEEEMTYPAEPTPGTETADITFLADMPASKQVSTRSTTGSIPENKIDNIYVLAFDKATGELIYKAKGKNLAVAGSAVNENRVTFKATLPTGTEYTFMVLANAESKLTGIDVGMSPKKNKSDVMALTLEQSGKWSSTSPAIPMWGEKDLTLTASSTPNFDLTRMLARINVEVNLKEIAPGTTKENFRLTSVRYYNYNTSGALVPDPDNYDTETKQAEDPTIPTPPGTKTGSALLYNGTDINDQKECKEKIYVFEAEHNGSTYTTPGGNGDWIDNPCLVIGGQYKTEDEVWLDETFYRIDFIRKDKTDPNNVKDVWLSLLRNWSYNVVVTEVNGTGYDDPEVALKSAPINMEAQVLDWHDRDMGEIVFDGVFYLSVSQDEFVFQRNAVDAEQEDNVVYIKTDYVYDNNKNHAESGWKVDRYEHIDGTQMTPDEQWLTLVPERGAPDVITKAYFTYKTNTGNDNREANVWIAAGRLRYKIHIVQRVLSLDIVDPDAGDAPIEEMMFVVPRTGDRSHPPRHFKVNWTPVSESVAITDESPHVWNPFAPEWLTPNPDGTQSWIIPGGTGTQTYTVQAPAVDDDALALDPFYERETTYYFEVDNGTDSEKKGINLHQIYYNIIVDTYTYQLDGKTYTLSVRSNTDWVITGIEEWLYNTDPSTLSPGERPTNPVLLQLNQYDNLKVGTTGSPNTSGESIAFTVVNQESDAHKNKWGTVYVTFENPDGKFPPQRVALRFPPKKITILGLGFARDVRAYNAAFPSTYHQQGAYRVLNSRENFGSLTESKVQVAGFDLIGHNCENLPGIGGTADSNWQPGSLKKWLNEHKPDIIICTYSMQFNEADAQLLNRYLEHGGVVIMYSYGGAGVSAANVRTLLNPILGKDLPEGDYYGLGSYGNVFTFTGNIDDPVTNGPFGDVRDKKWGTHYYITGVKTSSIINDVYVLSRTDDRVVSQYALTPGFTTAFRHKTKNFVFFGNGQFLASYYTNINEIYHDPFRNDNNYNPIPKKGFGPTGVTAVHEVYNSVVFANTIAWAMSVANHMPPPGGY